MERLGWNYVKTYLLCCLLISKYCHTHNQSISLWLSYEPRLHVVIQGYSNFNYKCQNHIIFMLGWIKCIASLSSSINTFCLSCIRYINHTFSHSVSLLKNVLTCFTYSNKSNWPGLGRPINLGQFTQLSSTQFSIQTIN